MGDYAEAAEFYDLLYQEQKDYPAEAQLLRDEILAAHPFARTVLDVGCGTGAHARALIDAGFQVDGIDLEPRFVEIARKKCPEGRFEVGDMTRLDLPRRYDVVTCLFSAIGYVRTLEGLGKAIRCMAGHVEGSGPVIVDPWFEHGQLTDGWVMTIVARSSDSTVCRMSRTVLDGDVSRLEFEYLVGSAAGIERRSEVHQLGLFSESQMRDAFASAGMVVDRRPETLGTRGLYVGRLMSRELH